MIYLLLINSIIIDNFFETNKFYYTTNLLKPVILRPLFVTAGSVSNNLVIPNDYSSFTVSTVNNAPITQNNDISSSNSQNQEQNSNNLEDMNSTI